MQNVRHDFIDQLVQRKHPQMKRVQSRNKCFWEWKSYRLHIFLGIVPIYFCSVFLTVHDRSRATQGRCKVVQVLIYAQLFVSSLSLSRYSLRAQKKLVHFPQQHQMDFYRRLRSFTNWNRVTRITKRCKRMQRKSVPFVIRKICLL